MAEDRKRLGRFEVVAVLCGAVAETPLLKQ
jgi:hypothetical protein